MKNKKTIGIASKIGTQPKEMTAEAIENAVKLVHNPPAQNSVQPVVAEKVPSRKVRLSIDVTPEEHKQLKLKAVENDTTIMQYVQKLIQADIKG